MEIGYSACFQIPVHPESRSYLRFCLNGQVYQFRALCFRPASAPQVFTQVFSLSSDWAYHHEIRLLQYLDDWLVVAESREHLLHYQYLLLQLYKNLGIVINLEKSDLESKRQAVYLGMLVDKVRE